MALLPESCCSRDLASYCGEGKARPGRPLADVPELMEPSHLVLKPELAAGRKALLPTPAEGLRVQTSTYLGIDLPPKEHVR